MAAPGRGPLRIAIEDFLNTFGFGRRAADWLRDRLEQWELEAIDAYDGFLTASGLGANVPELIKPASLRALTKHQIALVAILLPLAWNIVSSVTSVLVAPFARPLGYLAEGLAHTRHPDALTIAEIMQRRPDLADRLKSLVAGTGYDDLSWEGLRSLAAQLLTPADYVRLRLRGAITPEQEAEQLARVGLGESDRAGLDELSKLIPGSSDLIAMAVREAWNDETVQRFQYDAGFDDIPEFVEYMTKQGYSEDWARRYWRAHWQLPGVNQVYEMLHRLRDGSTQTSIDDVRLYLKTADIPEYWRDRLIAISYQPYTRVDIRRMYKANILDRDGVYQAHLDIGYDPEHAEKLTAFVTADSGADKQQLTREAVISAYKRGLIDGSRLISSLTEIGLSGQEAEFYKSIADYDISAQTTDVELSVIQAKYLNGTLDEPGLAGALGALNLPSERTTALTQLWTIQKTNRTNVPSRAELDDLLRRSIIDHTVYAAQLHLDGYNAESVDWFTRRVDQIIAADSAAEAAAAQSEQDRIQTSTRSTVYQRDRADLAVQIAQVRAAIADITLALHDVTDDAQRRLMTSQVAHYRNIIVQLQLSIAQLKLEFLTPPTP